MAVEPALYKSAALIVGIVTLARLVALTINKTDLYVDESQYWLWGQNLDFGYYSKPPLIGWLIGAVTWLAGSDAPFWVRAPGAVLHGATALILAALARSLWDARTGFWVAVSYVTLPMTALGSLLMSTDTVMAPFFAAALLFHARALRDGGLGFAALAGTMAGAAFMAKYAGAYFLFFAALAAVFRRDARLSVGQWSALLIAFAVVVSPNVLWNLSHDLTTVEHTMDNARWVRGGAAFGGLRPDRLAEFILSQLVVVGPVLFIALVWGWWRGADRMLRRLLWLSLPVLIVVSVQALLSKANANWAIATYFAGTLIAIRMLAVHRPALLYVSLAINGTIAVILPVLAVLAPWPYFEGKPLLSRYLGQSQLSRQITATANELGTTVVVAAERAILADLFYSASTEGLTIYAPSPTSRPQNYYEQTYPLPAGSDEVLYVGDVLPDCSLARLVEKFDTSGGGYDGRDIRGWLMPGDCLPHE